MFWKCMRWGGTLIMLVAIFAAMLMSSAQEGPATPAQPASGEATPSKNFNL